MTDSVFDTALEKRFVDSSEAVAVTSADVLLIRDNETGLILKLPVSVLTNAINNAAPVQSVAGKTGTVTIAKSDVGLSNVDNTSDSNKPISTATQTALNTKQSTSEKGQANGYAGLDSSGKVPSLQLPSFVDDVLEFANLASFPSTGESGKIYVALDTNKTYRWSGSSYVYITSGAVDSVAGKTGVVVLNKSDVGLNNVDNTSDANKPVSTATQTALNTKEPSVTIGTNAQYWRGDKSWRDFATDARNVVLEGLSTATNAVILASDSILSALGKLQKQISDNLTTLSTHAGDTSNPHSVTKTQIGLGNVDNTSDSNKPVSTAQQTALNSKFDKSGGTITGETTVSERITASKAVINGTWTYRATTPGTGNSERSCYSFFGTFGNTVDYGRRRIADVIAGFDGGNWGSEYLSFGIGNNGAANDSAVITKEWARFNALGNFGLNTNAPTARLDINDNVLRLRVAKTPASATDTGNQGNFCWDDSYFYVCVASNTWKRAALATW